MPINNTNRPVPVTQLMSKAELEGLTYEELIAHTIHLQEEILKERFESRDICSVICDTNGIIKEVSKSFLNTFHYSNISDLAAESTSIYDLLFEKEKVKIRDWIESPLRMKSFHKAHVRFLDGKRNYRWVSMKLGEKIIDGKTVLSVDMSLLSSNQIIYDRLHLFESIILNINDAVLVTEAQPIDTPGPRVVYVNEAFTRMTGYTLEEIKGKSPRVLQGPETDKKALNKIKKALKNWESIEVELVNYRKDGTKFYVSSSIVPLADDTGFYTHWVSVQRDISQRKMQEVSLKRLATAVKNTQNNIIITDNKGAIEYVNDSFEKHTRYSLSDVTGKKPGEILQGEYTNPNTVELIRQAITEKKAFNGEIFNYTKDGRGYWNEIYIDPVWNQKKELIGFVGVQSDVTARNEIARKLYKQNKLLKQVNEELDQFVYSVSHDLRAPLASILGLLEITKLSDSEEERSSYLQYIEDNITKLDRFIHDINDFTKNSRLDLEFKEIDFKKLIHDIIKTLHYLPSVKSSEVNIEIEEGITIISDLRRLRIIFSNLLSNAFKYSRYYLGIDVIIDIKVSLEYNKILIQFIDNGIGIKEDYLAKIFDMFYQANKEAKGTGLGLYIVKQALLKLEGNIQVHSVLGKGSTFTLSLPCIKKLA